MQSNIILEIVCPIPENFLDQKCVSTETCYLSISNKSFFHGSPAPKPPRPSFETTLWHGMNKGIGLAPQAVPTARTAFGRFIFFAISPYVRVLPYGISPICCQTSCWKDVPFGEATSEKALIKCASDPNSSISKFRFGVCFKNGRVHFFTHPFSRSIAISPQVVLKIKHWDDKDLSNFKIVFILHFAMVGLIDIFPVATRSVNIF